MFDIGFWELILVGVVALLVLGPERLPKAARIAGLWASRARRAVASLRAEIEREVDLGELKRLEQEANAGMRDLIAETRAEVPIKDPISSTAEPKERERGITADGQTKRFPP